MHTNLTLLLPLLVLGKRERQKQLALCLCPKLVQFNASSAVRVLLLLAIRATWFSAKVVSFISLLYLFASPIL